MSVDRKLQLLDWSSRLAGVAASAPVKNIAGAAFSDEAGHARTIDGPLLRWRSRSPGRAPLHPLEPDVALWWALSDPSIDAATVLRQADAPRTTADAHALLPVSSAAAIEVWTERELACLHALWWLSRRTPGNELSMRLTAAVNWHIEHIQPDNATAHPWALHVFLAHAITEPNGVEARLYAETQLHNCRVSLGYPDALSREILLDAADALKTLADD